MKLKDNITLVTSAYYNIEGYPHYGADRAGRIKMSLPNILLNTQLPVVCYTSKKYGCYDELQILFEQKNITNITLKIFELEDHHWHMPILQIRESSEKYKEMYKKKPILVYWLKFYFMLNELNTSDYLYWVDSGLSHNGLFPKRYSINSDDSFGMGDSNCTYNFTCFSAQAFDNINKFVQDKVLHVVRPATDADVSDVIYIPELNDNYVKNLTPNWPSHWPVAGMFGGSTNTLYLKQYLEKTIETFQIMIYNKKLTVEEGVMAYMDVAYSELFKRYHFENFYTEHEKSPGLHLKEDGSVFHHFYRLLCDDAPLVDYLGNT